MTQSCQFFSLSIQTIIGRYGFTEKFPKPESNKALYRTPHLKLEAYADSIQNYEGPDTKRTLQQHYEKANGAHVTRKQSWILRFTPSRLLQSSMNLHGKQSSSSITTTKSNTSVTSTEPRLSGYESFVSAKSVLDTHVEEQFQGKFMSPVIISSKFRLPVIFSR